MFNFFIANLDDFFVPIYSAKMQSSSHMYLKLVQCYKWFQKEWKIGENLLLRNANLKLSILVYSFTVV